MKYAVLGALAALGFVSAACADTIVVPSQYAHTEAPSDGVIISHADTHMQLQFKASDFGSAPITFSGVSFRYDQQVTDFYQPVATFNFGSSFNVEMATATSSLANRSTTYAANLGSDLTTVMSGAQTVTAAVGGPAGQMKTFGITFNFANDFTYDPGAGDLVLDMFLPNVSQFADMDYTRDDHSLGIIYSNGSGAAVPSTGMAFGGPVTEFLTVPNPPLAGAAPEPGSWALMLTGFGLAGGMLRGRRRTAAAT